MASNSTDHYPELSKIIQEEGLLDKQPAYYWYKILSTLGLLIFGIILLAVVDNFWFQLANAAFLAFVYGQIGYIGHDAGHRGVFSSFWENETVGLVVGFFLGLSPSWWKRVHNQHHTRPNDLEEDPHARIPILAFSEETARDKPGFIKLLVKYQAFYFVPLLLTEGINIHVTSVNFLAKQWKAKHTRIESVVMGLHFLTYFGVLFYLLSPLQALGFVLVHQGLFGLYYGTVFAPNHKGMLILDKNNPLDFLRTQVLTTRNVKPGILTDFWFGGLNHQIEHHLFPSMPRNNLGKARKIIKEFCQRYGITYYETSTFRSYREILQSLWTAGHPGQAVP